MQTRREVTREATIREIKQTALARAYRTWALADPQGFTLVFGPPPSGVARGHQGEAHGPGKAAAVRAMEGLRSLIREAEAAGTRRPAPMTLPPVLVEAFSDKMLHGADPATELALCHTWASLHGYVTLEAYGNLSWHGPEVRESLFLGLVRMLAEAMGLPEPAA